MWTPWKLMLVVFIDLIFGLAQLLALLTVAE